VAEVFSGFVCGYAIALIATPAAALALVRARVESAALRRIFPPEAPLVTVSLFLHILWFFLFTAVGMLFGLALHGFERRHPAGGIGSPNALFTIVVLAITTIAILPPAVLLPRWRAPLIAGGTVFAVTFGWVMPYLAQIGPGQG